MWGNVGFSSLRKQHDGRDWASNNRPSDLKTNVLTTIAPPPNSYYPRDRLASHPGGRNSNTLRCFMRPTDDVEFWPSLKKNFNGLGNLEAKTKVSN